MNAQWLGDILLGDFEALREMQCRRYSVFGLPDPFAPAQHLVLNLLGERASCPDARRRRPGLAACAGSRRPCFLFPPFRPSPFCPGSRVDRPFDGRRT